MQNTTRTRLVDLSPETKSEPKKNPSLIVRSGIRAGLPPGDTNGQSCSGGIYDDCTA